MVEAVLPDHVYGTWLSEHVSIFYIRENTFSPPVCTTEEVPLDKPTPNSSGLETSLYILWYVSFLRLSECTVVRVLLLTGGGCCLVLSHFFSCANWRRKCVFTNVENAHMLLNHVPYT